MSIAALSRERIDIKLLPYSRDLLGLSPPHHLLSVIRLIQARPHLPFEDGKIHHDLFPRPAERVGNEQQIALGILLQRELGELANLLEPRVPGPAPDRLLP